ncbi:beta-galactosidase [bacterium]|nr:beta-galactosidase [bacterium]
MKSCISPAIRILFLVWLTVAGCGQGRGDVLVLDDFEGQESLARWHGPVSLSADSATHGSGSLRLDLGERSSRILESESLPKDWSAYDYLRFDIFSPQENVRFGTFWIFDELGDDEQAETYGQSYRGTQRLFINPGWNHYEFQLKKMMVENNDRPLALDRIRRFRLEFGRIGGTLYLDNLRLVRGEEDPQSASRVQPRDCLVLVDNSEVRSRLATPFDKLVPEPEIAILREKAAAAVDRLNGAVERAEKAGWFSLYWRVPLITAGIGLQDRRKLVWFQSERRESEILEHIVTSCGRAANEIDSLLASGAAVPPLEQQARYARPYPPLKGLPIRDGFFRYDNGDPVILYAMHGHIGRELRQYFGPYDHVLESYTVGGASRFNVESTPVYAAFHKYPDTHRVGWDGWCGHLIKDRWSEGGRIENVVICLESEHMKEAILQSMKPAADNWLRNPDLLYNIMGYELMYICYCDKSQQMFRQWLKDKYASLEKVNAAWGTAYADWDSIRAPECRNAAPLPDINRAAWYDWALFNNRRFTDHMKWIKSEMRKLDPVVPICAGGTSSMLSASNSTTGIDEELIVNEVDDVILNESGHSLIFSDLMPSLADRRMVMVEPEAGGNVHNTLLHFLHGKSTLAKYKWDSANPEYPSGGSSSVLTSWDISLGDIDDILRLSLDVRRLNREIAAFYGPEPEVLLLYSKTCIIQVPPDLHQAWSTPYLETMGKAWEGSRFLGARVGFVTERQALSGKLDRCRLLIVPAVKYLPPEVVQAVLSYVERGGTALVIPESFLFDQYARGNDGLAGLGLKVKGVTLPPVLGQGGMVKNYDQSYSQTLLYGEVRREMTTEKADIFAGQAVSLQAEGLVQSLDAGRNRVLARLDDGAPGLVLVTRGKGRLYYLAAPLEPLAYHRVLEPLAASVGLARPVLGVGADNSLVTGAEVRGIEYDGGWLVYASNVGDSPVEFDLKGESPLGAITDLRRLQKLSGTHVKLGPWEETIFRVEKKQ